MHRISIYQVCRGSVGNSVYQKWKFFFDKHKMKSSGILGYPTVSKCLLLSNTVQQKLFYFLFRKTANLCIMHAIQSNCCSQKVSISLFLSYAPFPNNPVLNPITRPEMLKSGRLFPGGCSRLRWRHQRKLCRRPAANGGWKWHVEWTTRIRVAPCADIRDSPDRCSGVEPWTQYRYRWVYRLPGCNSFSNLQPVKMLYSSGLMWSRRRAARKTGSFWKRFYA